MFCTSIINVLFAVSLENSADLLILKEVVEQIWVVTVHYHHVDPCAAGNFSGVYLGGHSACAKMSSCTACCLFNLRRDLVNNVYRLGIRIAPRVVIVETVDM